MVRIDGGSHIPHNYNPNLENVRPMTPEMKTIYAAMQKILTDSDSHLDIDPNHPDTDSFWRVKGKELMVLASNLRDKLLNSEIGQNEQIYKDIMSTTDKLMELATQMGDPKGVAESSLRKRLNMQIQAALSNLVPYNH